MFTNHEKEDGIYSLKRDNKAQNKDQRSIVTTIENIIVHYIDET